MADAHPTETIDQVDERLARRLIAAQFADWKHLAVRPVETSGWDNRTFRLGERMLVRLPSASRYAPQVEKEQRWLPRLRGRVPLPIPRPLAMGRPGCGYPWPWSVYRWIEGTPAASGRVDSLAGLAEALADFLVALQRADPAGGPVAGRHNFFRGGSLAHYDGEARRAIAARGDVIDRERATGIWDRAVASTWERAPVWVHGDVDASNLLVRDGRLAAVIDFGCLGVGDPACDLAIAWTFFGGPSRRVFRDALPLDRPTWERARGWALWKAAITLAEHVDAADPTKARAARRVMGEILADPLDAG